MAMTNPPSDNTKNTENATETETENKDTTTAQRKRDAELDLLEETWTQYTKGRRKYDDDNRAIKTIDRWGPGVLSIITFLVVIGMGWQFGEQMARIEGRQSVVIECVAQQAELKQSLKALEETSTQNREKFELEILKLNSFKDVVVRVLIKAGLM